MQFVWHKPGRNGLSVPTSGGMNDAAPAKLVSDQSAWFGSDGTGQQRKVITRERKFKGTGQASEPLEGLVVAQVSV